MIIIIKTLTIIYIVFGIILSTYTLTLKSSFYCGSDNTVYIKYI